LRATSAEDDEELSCPEVHQISGPEQTHRYIDCRKGYEDRREPEKSEGEMEGS